MCLLTRCTEWGRVADPFLTPLKDPYPITLCQRQRFHYSWQGLPLGKPRRGVAQGFYSDTGKGISFRRALRPYTVGRRQPEGH